MNMTDTTVAVPITSAPRPSARRNDTAALVEGQPELVSATVATWKGRVVALLERKKSYPAEARARGERGVVQTMFSIDRSGAWLRAGSPAGWAPPLSTRKRLPLCRAPSHFRRRRACFPAAPST